MNFEEFMNAYLKNKKDKIAADPDIGITIKDVESGVIKPELKCLFHRSMNGGVRFL